MSILFRTNSSVDCNILTSYDKLKHDLYTWNYQDWPTGEPIFGTISQPGQWGGLYPNGYNQSCYSRDLSIVPDLSGKSTRARRFGGSVSGWYTNFGRPACFPVSNPSSATLIQQELAKNIGNWNYGEPTGILISPMHVLICGHFVGNANTISFNFLLKNNQQITRVGQRVTGNNAGNLLNGDIRIYRLNQNEKLDSFVNQNLITIYDKFLDNESPSVLNFLNTFHFLNPLSPSYTNILSWMVDGADRVVRGCLNFFNISGTPEQTTRILFEVRPDSLFLYLPNDTSQPSSTSIFSGDSGSPKFVYDINTNKTICVGLNLGGELEVIENQQPNLNNFTLINQELNTFGYSISKLNINNVRLATLGDAIPSLPNNNQSNYIPYTNTFDNIIRTPLYKYPYSSRIYTDA